MSNFYIKVFARFYDKTVQKAEEKELVKHKKSLLSGLKGDFLEMEAGTGANFHFYAPDVNLFLK